MPNFKENGLAHIVVILLVAALLALAYLIWQGKVKTPLTSPNKQEPNVSLQTIYDNPFDKNAQYVNPFDTYKNPFDSL